MEILTTPNDFLRKKAKPVKKLDQKTIKQVKQMIKTLISATDPQGVGLAATQVGIDKRIFILLLQEKPHIFINPQIKEKSQKTFTDHYPDPQDHWLEGCLSIPKTWGFVDRPYQVTLDFQTFNPQTKNPKLISKTQTYQDMESAYTQHEIDHLNGILFTDRIIKQGGTIYKETKQGLVPVPSPQKPVYA